MTDKQTISKMDPFWLHIQQYSTIYLIYLWLYMYTSEDSQQWPRHVVFNKWIDLLIYVYSIQSVIIYSRINALWDGIKTSKSVYNKMQNE
jgi:hypothetical protein